MKRTVVVALVIMIGLAHDFRTNVHVLASIHPVL